MRLRGEMAEGLRGKLELSEELMWLVSQLAVDMKS